MRCAELAELISAYADEQTTASEAERVEAHLRYCRQCAETLERYRQTRCLLTLGGDAPRSIPDLRLRVALATRSVQSRPAWGARLTSALAVAVMLSAVLGLFALHSAGPQGAATSIAPANQTLDVASAPALPGTAPASAPTQCPQGRPANMARCLGVSRYWLPTVLADGPFVTLDQPSALNPLPASGQSHARAGLRTTTTKGGGVHAISRRYHFGVQAV